MYNLFYRYVGIIKYSVFIIDQIQTLYQKVISKIICYLQNSNETVHKDVWSFSIPKLTNEELKLVKEKNKEHMMIYLYGDGADFRVEEMKKSDSKDKYVKCICQRKTVYLTQEWDNTN